VGAAGRVRPSAVLAAPAIAAVAEQALDPALELPGRAPTEAPRDAPQAERRAEHKEASDDRRRFDAGGDERPGGGCVLAAVASERRGGTDARGHQEEAAGVERGEGEAHETPEILEWRTDGERPGAAEAAGEQPSAEHGDDRDADHGWTGEEQDRRPVVLSAVLFRHARACSRC